MYNREKRTEFLLSFIDFAKAKTFLDMGCGKGSDLIEISKKASEDSQIVGVDISEKSIDVAKELTASDNRFQFMAHNMETAFPFEDDTFDVITPVYKYLNNCSVFHMLVIEEIGDVLLSPLNLHQISSSLRLKRLFIPHVCA